MFKEMVAGIEQKLFEGDQTGKCPKYSLLDLDQANFRYAMLVYSGVHKSEASNKILFICYRVERIQALASHI